MASTQVRDEATVRLLTCLQFALPLVIVLIYIIAFTVESILGTKKEPDTGDDVVERYGPGGKLLPKIPKRVKNDNEATALDFSKSRKLFFIWLSIAVTLTYLANAVNVVAHALVNRSEGWWCGQSATVYIAGSFLAYTYLTLSIVDNSPSPTTAHLITWIINIILEVVVLAASIAIYSKRHHENHVVAGALGRIQDHMTEWELAEVLTEFIRIFIILALVIFYVIFAISRNAKIRATKIQVAASEDAVGETTGLLSEPQIQEEDVLGLPSAVHPSLDGRHGSPNGYGTASPGPVDRPVDDTPGLPSSPNDRTIATARPGSRPADEGVPGWVKPETMPKLTWFEYLKGYSVFFPFLWPSKEKRLQAVVVASIIITIAQRVVNVLVPSQAGHITNILSADNDEPVRMPWLEICLYIFYRMMQGNQGILGALRSNLWLPVSQYSYREMAVASFEHVHSLSLDFHLGKMTGEVISALNKGTSINNFLELMTFQVVPMLVDLVVAMTYFLVVFDVYYVLVVATVTFWYVYITVRLAASRYDIRRQMVNADRAETALKNDSLQAYETVKYFNAEEYEFGRYRDAVEKYQKAEYITQISLNFMNVSQNLVFTAGLLVACFIAAFQVSSGQRKVGQFVALLTYMAQLQQPLNFFGTFYRQIQGSMINAERLLELFKVQPTVLDRHDATRIERCEGDIMFDNIKFAYNDRKPALQSLSFRALPGTTTALVGESGGGKSTVFRLLFRFYDAESGRIMVDGNDVTDITIDSLRSHIGVVPQDAVLFNETLMFNLKYANQAATDEDVYAACRAASIHDRIMAFPDGYKSNAGDRGLRLSGGERQRIAIARTILKNPRIILLDEATAALDTGTEEHIQKAFATLGQGRTMLVIAHRLSTITHANQILVIHEGCVDERGTHAELLQSGGRYAGMWRKQVRAQKAAEQAKVLTDEANRLRQEANEGDDGSAASASPNDDAHGEPHASSSGAQETSRVDTDGLGEEDDGKASTAPGEAYASSTHAEGTSGADDKHNGAEDDTKTTTSHDEHDHETTGPGEPSGHT